jgi:hypothetical protein
MLALRTRLRPNEGQVAARVMDGEAIMINLSNGMYYSMDGVGGLIWEMIEGRHSLEEIAATIVLHHDVLPEQAQADVQRLVEELVQENLVQVSDDQAPNGAGQREAPEEQLCYEPPQLTTYRDMGDLLALDPPTPGGAQEFLWREPDGLAPG